MAELGNDSWDKWSWFIPALFKVMFRRFLPPLGPWVLPELKGPVYMCREEQEVWEEREGERSLTSVISNGRRVLLAGHLGLPMDSE